MIAASAVLVVAALVLLIVGVFQDGLELVFGSIAASIVAAISLFLGVMKDRRAPVTAPGYPVEGAPVGGLAPTSEEPQAIPTISPVDEELPAPEEAPTLTGVGSATSLEEAPPLILPDEDELEMPAAPAPAIGTTRKPAAKKPAAKKAAAKKPAAKKPAAKRAAAKKPAVKKPAAKKAAAKKPAAKKPAAKKPAAKKPAAKKTTTKRPSSS